MVAGVAATLLLRHAAPALAIASWRSPTAFLLQGPGDDILRTVPGASSSIVRLEMTAATDHNQ